MKTMRIYVHKDGKKKLIITRFYKAILKHTHTHTHSLSLAIIPP